MPLIKNNTLRPMGVDGVFIMPGVNKIESEIWEKRLKPLLKDKIEEGIVENMDSKADDDFEEGLAAYNAKDAIALVNETADEDLLNSWLVGEKRSTVLKALNDRLATLEEAVTDGDDEE